MNRTEENQIEGGKALQERTFDVLFGFDMETDIGSFTPFYEGVVHGTGPLLEILGKHDIKSTFYWTGHAAENNPSIIRHVMGQGHEIGCHGLFHETLGDPIFPLPNNWPILPSEVKGRLEKATKIIEEVCGVAPVSFRCPRLWGSTTVVNELERLGYVSDASFPLYFYQTPFTPYHPSKEDWTKPGGLNILEIPNFCDLQMESSDPYQRDRDQWPLFRTRSSSELMKRVDGFIRYVLGRRKPVVLCFYFHPWEFYAMPQGPIDFGECTVQPLPFIVQNCGQKAVRQLDILCDMLLERGAKFVTAKELAVKYSKTERTAA